MVEGPQHRFEEVAWKARTRRDPEARQLEHRPRLLPGEEVAELVGADEEQRIVEALGAEQVDRTRVGIEPHVVIGERRACELEPRHRRQMDVLVTGALGHEHLEAGKFEPLFRRARDGDVAGVRRIEGAAEQA